jgi:lipocalin
MDKKFAKSKKNLISIFCIFLIIQISFISCKKLSLTKAKDIAMCKKIDFSNSQFNLQQFLGTWYPLLKTDSLPIFSTCDYITFSMPNNSTTLTGEIKNRQTGQTSFKLDLAKSNNSNSFTFSYIVKNMLSVVDTDYKSYAILYTCTDLVFDILHNAMILSRTENLPQETLDKLKNIIKEKFGGEAKVNISQRTDKCPARS